MPPQMQLGNIVLFDWNLKIELGNFSWENQII